MILRRSHLVFTRLALSGAGLLAVSGCLDTGALGLGYAQLSVTPVLRTRETGIVPVDRARFLLTRSGGAVALDTVVQAAAGADSMDVTLRVLLHTSGEAFSLTVALIDPAGDTVLRGGPVTVTAQGASTASNAVAVPLTYAAPTTLRGTYAITDYRFDLNAGQSPTPATGLPLPAPRGFHSEVGAITFDGAGGGTASTTENSDGTVASKPGSFTYTVAADGSVAISADSGSTVAAQALAGGAALIGAATSGRPEMFVLLEKGGTYSNASLNGAYAFTDFRFEQSTSQPPTPAAGAPLPVPLGSRSQFGTITFDGAGNGVAATTKNSDGTATTENATFTYSVASDGSLLITTDSGTPVVGSVVAGGGVILGAATGGSPEVFVLVKKPTSATNASLNGVYTLAGIRFDLSATQSLTPSPGQPLPAPRGIASQYGAIRLDGAGNGTGSIIEDASGTATTQPAIFTYVVAGDGGVTISTSDGPLTGGMLAGGAVVIGAKLSGSPGIFVLIRQ